MVDTQKDYERARLQNLMHMAAYHTAHMYGIPETEVDYRYGRLDETEEYDYYPRGIDYLVEVCLEDFHEDETDAIYKDACSIFYDDLGKFSNAFKRMDAENRNVMFHTVNHYELGDKADKDLTWEQVKELAVELNTGVYLVLALYAFKKED